MGYSTYAEFNTVERKEKMMNFLRLHYRELDDMVGAELITVSAATLSDDLSYVDKKHKYIVGFDYQAWICHYERHYLNSLTKWIALNAGHERPYTIYDGCEIQWVTNVNEHGWSEHEPRNQFPNSGDLLCYNTLLKQELENLSGRWEAYKKQT